MRERAIIYAALAVFLLLATFPFWYTLGAGGDSSPPDLERPRDGIQCVEDREFMAAHHMDLLDQWRNAVVREGQSQYVSKAFGKQYEMSLTKTCMGCHTNRETFCQRCHEYADVLPLQLPGAPATAQRSRGIGCWDCHVESKGD
jgi:hypothetical protein